MDSHNTQAKADASQEPLANTDKVKPWPGILPPRVLFQKLTEGFSANDSQRHLVTEQVSRGKAPETRYEHLESGTVVEARTKSEARALLKKKLGKLPAGTQIVKRNP